MDLPTSIDVDTISEVLLPVGWMRVRQGSFSVTPYEFRESGVRVHSGAAGTGYHFQEPEGGFVSGPIGAILAIRH